MASPEVPVEPGSRYEAEVLVSCARVVVDEATKERIRWLVRQELDWERLLFAARWHGVTPLLNLHLNAICGEDVPQTALEELRGFVSENTRKNLQLTAELCRIVKLYASHGITAIPFKGPLLATSAHGNLALRQFGDLDVLMDKRDIRKAIEIAKDAGFEPASEMTPAQDAAVLRHDNEYPMYREADRVFLELHWRFVPNSFSFPLDARRLSPRLEPVSLGGVTIPAVSVEDMLLIVCVHSTKHLWRRLRWVSDVGEIVRANPDLDWELVISRAKELGCERMLYLGLLIAEDLVGTQLPPVVGDRAHAQPALKALVDKVRALILEGGVEAEFEGARGHGAPGYFDRSFFFTRAMDRRSHRVNYFARFLVTPNEEDWEGLPLPGPLFPLYYLYRPLRMTKWMARWLWRRATTRRSAGVSGATEGTWLETR